MLAAIRPDNVDFPLLVHVLGAIVLVGGLVTALVAQFSGFTRLSFRALLFAALPGYIVMRVGGEWIYRRAGWDELDPAPSWIDIGYITADIGALVLLIALILAGLAARRGSSTLARIAAGLTTILLVAYVVAVWAMTSKPT